MGKNALASLHVALRGEGGQVGYVEDGGKYERLCRRPPTLLRRSIGLSCSSRGERLRDEHAGFSA